MRTAAALLLLLSAPAGAASLTGADLQALCLSAAADEQRACLGWIQARWRTIEGAVLLLAETGGDWLFCQPADLTFEAVRDRFLDWSGRHPERLDDLDRTVLTEALQDAFPCSGPRSP